MRHGARLAAGRPPLAAAARHQAPILPVGTTSSGSHLAACRRRPALARRWRGGAAGGGSRWRGVDAGGLLGSAGGWAVKRGL